MRFIVLFFISLLYQFSYGQFYPVQSTPQLVPPYSVYLSDYATPGNEKLRVILVQRDLTHPSYQLRLVMSVELNGNIIMRTSRTYNPPPISLNPGIPTIISGGDLAPYLDSRNIDFVGYSKEQYERTKALSEGSYRIIFTAYDYRRQDVQVSNAGGTYYYLSKSEPPLINYPACGSTVAMRMPQQIVFSWLSRNTSSPGSAADTEYQLELFETRPAGRNPNDIVLSTQPVFKTLLSTTQYVYTPADPLLLENMVYVWRVRAIDRNGKDAIRNNGYSEVCTFTYSGIDPDFNIGVVKNLQAQARTERMARVWWDIGDFDSYRVNYRKTGNDYEWFTSDVLGNQLKEDSKDRGEIKLYDLEPDTEYEARVQGKKKGYLGGYTDIVKFRTPPHKVAQCGDNDSLPYGDMTKPSNAIIKGTIVQLDDMEMVLLNVTPLGKGWYRGIGKVSIDYFGGANFALKFDRLFIDENHVAGYGRVDYISKGIAEMLVQQAENLAQQAKEQTWQQNRDAWAGTAFYSKVIAYDIAIDTITAEGIGYLTITDREGNTTTNAEAAQILLASPDKAIIIQDKNGDQYVVQKDKTTGHTKVTKVEGGGLQPGNATVPALIKDRLVVAILEQFEEEMAAWLRNNGKGGDIDDDLLLATELPACFKRDAGQLTYLKNKIIPYYKEHPAELVAKIETDKSNRKLFDKASSRFNKADEFDWSKVPAGEQEDMRNSTGLALVDRIAPLIQFYDKAAPSLRTDDYKKWLAKVQAIYSYFKTCSNEGWESYQDEGIVPYCFWRDQKVSTAAYYSNADIPFTAGLIDGAYREAEGVYHLPELVRNISRFPGKLIYTYTVAYWKCTPEKLVASAEQYEYVLEQLATIEEEGGVWNWVKGKWYDYKDQKENLEEYFVDCRDANEIREGVNELYEIVTNWEEITKLYNQVSQRINAYLNTLENADNIGRYERGRLVVPVVSTALTLGGTAATKIEEIKNILKSLRTASEGSWKKVTEGIGKFLTKEAATIKYTVFSKSISFGGEIIKTSGKKLNVLGRVLPLDGTIGTKALCSELISQGLPESELLGLFQQIPREWKNLRIVDQNAKYWKEINKVYIDNVIANGGYIRFIHDPRLPVNQWNYISSTAIDAFSKQARAEGLTKVKTFLKMEYDYLVSKGYTLTETGLMIKQ